MGAVLAGAVVSALVAGRLGVPVLVGFLALGMLLGSDGPGGIEFDDADLAREVGIIGLALILYEGGLLLLAAAAPIILGVGFIGRKLIRDERQRQLTYRRQQAKMSCRRYLDEANFVIEKDCLDSLRRTRRELRDEFQARAGVLHASSQRALSSAERAASLSPQERDQRSAELAARRAEIERLGKAPAASRGAA